MNKAYLAYQSIKGCIAFSMPTAKRKKVNQYLTVYTFADGSELLLYSNGKALVPNFVVGEYRAY